MDEKYTPAHESSYLWGNNLIEVRNGLRKKDARKNCACRSNNKGRNLPEATVMWIKCFCGKICPLQLLGAVPPWSFIYFDTLRNFYMSIRINLTLSAAVNIEILQYWYNLFYPCTYVVGGNLRKSIKSNMFNLWSRCLFDTVLQQISRVLSRPNVSKCIFSKLVKLIRKHMSS